MRNRPLNFANRNFRNATAMLALLGICASILPIPLGWIVRDSKDLSEPFPCQHCACGCKNAEQCWRNCCCFTPSQKAAWARENRVTAPTYAALDADKRVARFHQAQANVAKSCCSKTPGSAHKKADSAHSSNAKLCSNRKCTDGSGARESTSAHQPTEDTDEETAESLVLLSMLASKCSGQATVFSLLHWAIIERSPSTTTCWELSGLQSPHESLRPIRVFLIPDVPPPRSTV